MKSAITALEISWTGVKSVRETAAEWLLRIAGGGLIALPKTAISRDDDATLRAFLVDRELVHS